jgi:carboxymethylenebutenolidase
MNTITKQYVNIAVSDGTSMQMYMAKPDKQESMPGILVFQEAFGVNAHIREVTERIAAEGYIAMAPELFHRSAAPGFEGSYTDFQSVMPHTKALTPEGLEADIRAAYGQLVNTENVLPDKIAAIGFCMGGRVAFMASTILPLSSAASFYGSGIENLLGTAGEISCPLLFCWGGLDKHITKDKIALVTDGLTEREKDYVSVIYSRADHGFFCDARASYNPGAAAEGWALVKAFWQVNW